MDTTIDKKYIFVIECNTKEAFDVLCGYMSDGGGEQGILNMLEYDLLDIETQDIRNESQEYVGIQIKQIGYLPEHPLYIDIEDELE